MIALWVLLSVGCGGASVVGTWELDDVSPVGTSTAATEDTTGCLEVRDDLGGTLSIAFLAGTTNVVAFTGSETEDGRYAFDLDHEILTCDLSGDTLPCDLASPDLPEAPYTRLTFRRGDCTPASPTTPSGTPDELAFGSWGGHCTGSAGGDSVDSDVLMLLRDEAGALEGNFEFRDPTLSPSCGYLADFTLEGTRTADALVLDFVDRSTLPTYTCGSPDRFEPVRLDLHRDAANELSGTLATDVGGPLDCTFTGS